MLHAFVSKLKALLGRRSAADAEFDTELQTHIDLLVKRYEAQGLSPEDALSRARRQFGNLTSLKENRREQQSFVFLENTWRQFRLAVRQLRANPLFTTTAIISLALGMGANIAVFNILDQLILRLLPVKDPQSIVMIWAQGQSLGSENGDQDLSYPLYEKFQKNAAAFESVFCRFFSSADLSTGSRSERVLTELVSGNYFQALGTAPALGRVFSPSQDDRTYMGHPVVILTHAYWLSRFGGDPTVIGRKILINKYPMQIVGVTSPRFAGIDPNRSPQIFVPIQMLPVLEPSQNALGDRWSRCVEVFARLNAGYTVESAKAALQVLYQRTLREDAQDPTVRDATVRQIQQFLRQTVVVESAGTGYSELRKKYATALVVLMGMACLMLLVACTNVANLLIARAMARQKEIALHLAIGASRATLVSRLLTESLLLSLGGGIAGTFCAYLTSSGLLALIPEQERLNLHAEPDARIVIFTILVCVLTALVFGLTPALQGTRLDVWTTLKDSAGTLTGASGSVRLRKALVITQIALSFLLVAGATLFTRSLINLKDIDTGFHGIDQISTFQVDGPRAGYKIAAARAFYDRVLGRIRAVQGVTAASYAMVPVLNSYTWSSHFAVEGYLSKDAEDQRGFYNAVAPDYWRTTGIPLLAGRDFTGADQARTSNEDEQPSIAMVNRTFAMHFFGGVSKALGKHVGFAGMHHSPPRAQIIGVVEDSLYDGPRSGVRPQVFFAFRQVNWPLSAVFYVRAADASLNLIPTMRSIVSESDPNVPIYEATTLKAQLSATMGTERLIATLSIIFGVLAAVLAAIGLYGVMAFSVSRRTKEIGVRIALGAKQELVLWSVLREALWLILAGLVFGVPIACALSKYATSALFGVQPTDPGLYLLDAAVLAVIAVLSAVLPARRAANISPLIALRYE